MVSQHELLCWLYKPANKLCFTFISVLKLCNVVTFPVAAIMLCWVPAGINPLKGWVTWAGLLRFWAWACGGVCCSGGCKDWGRAINGCAVDPKLGREICDPGRGTVTWRESTESPVTDTMAIMSLSLLALFQLYPRLNEFIYLTRELQANKWIYRSVCLYNEF